MKYCYAEFQVRQELVEMSKLIKQLDLLYVWFWEKISYTDIKIKINQYIQQ